MTALIAGFIDPTRTDETEVAYLTEGRKLISRIGKLLGSDIGVQKAIVWFQKADELYAKNTIRTYRANLLAVSRHELADSKITQHEFAYINYLLSAENAPAAASKKIKKTSARKSKSIKPDEIELLKSFLRNSESVEDHFLLEIIKVISLFFCRPGELQTMEIIGNDIRFINAKASNGRGNGPNRTFVNAAKTETRRAYFRKFLQTLDEKIHKAGGWEPLCKALSSRLARRCQQIQIKRLCLYSFRHLGIASAKSVFSAGEVASLAGHSSNRTATTHYAKRRTGHLKLKEQMNFEPKVEDMLAVKMHKNWQRPQPSNDRVSVIQTENLIEQAPLIKANTATTNLPLSQSDDGSAEFNFWDFDWTKKNPQDDNQRLDPIESVEEILATAHNFEPRSGTTRPDGFFLNSLLYKPKIKKEPVQKTHQRMQQDHAKAQPKKDEEQPAQSSPKPKM